MRTALVVLGLVLGATAMGQALSQTAGVVQFVAGDVRLVQPGGGERAARKGVPVNVGDTLTTASGAMAQLKMGDGAIVVVVPESRVTVAEFRYAGVEDGTEKVRYRLEQGGFRAVTGAIGRTHKKNYLIETPIAHMGVRGTDHETYYFPVTGPVGGDDAKPGAYNKVNTGRTFIRTGAGEVEIDPNQVGFVASANEVPVILPAVPGFFNRSIAPRNARPAVTPATEPAEIADVQQDVEVEGGGNLMRLVRTRGPRVTPGTGMGPLVGYTIVAGMEKGTPFGGSGNGTAIDTSSAMLVSSGGDMTNGVKWDTWAGGVTIDEKTAVGNTYVVSVDPLNKTSALDLATLQTGGVTATYNQVPGAQFVANYLGTEGTINKLSVDVNFGTQMVTNYDLDVTVLANWKANGSGSISQFTGANGILLNGTCTGCTGSPSGNPATGTAHGTFVGSTAGNLVTTFGMSSASSQAVSGAAYLQK